MKEDKKLLLELYISNLRKSAVIIDKIIPVVKTFDGKVYNARFQNKINELLKEDKITLKAEDFDYKHCELELCFYQNRTVYTEENYSFDKEGTPKHRQVHYLPDCYDRIRICYIWTDYNSWDTSKNTRFHERNESYFWIDENYNTRINSSAIVENLTEHKEDLLKQAGDLEDALKVKEGFTECKIQAWEDAVKDLQKKAQELNSAIPSVVRDIFEIKSWANWQ